MEFDEQSNSGFPVALSAPGRLNLAERYIDRPLALSLEAYTGLRMYAPGFARTNVDSAVMVFSRHCTQTPAAHSAAPLPLSRTIH